MGLKCISSFKEKQKNKKRRFRRKKTRLCVKIKKKGFFFHNSKRTKPVDAYVYAGPYKMNFKNETSACGLMSGKTFQQVMAVMCVSTLCQSKFDQESERKHLWRQPILLWGLLCIQIPYTSQAKII